eukprot:s280_g23.t1
MPFQGVGQTEMTGVICVIVSLAPFSYPGFAFSKLLMALGSPGGHSLSLHIWSLWTPKVTRNRALYEANPEEVPLYVFMDWSAVQQFIDRKDELFSFQGLLNLCEQRLMCCVPPDSDVIVQDRDRIVFVVLNLVMDELLARANTPGERQKIEQLKTDENSPLQCCTRWGVVDVILDAPPPTELKKLPAGSEQVASELGISFRMVHLLDFAFLWDSNIEVPGRTLFVVAEEAMYQFSRKACLNQRGISVVHLRELEDRFAQDTRHGGGQLTLAAAKAGYCRAVLDATVLSAIAGELTRKDGGDIFMNLRRGAPCLTSDIPLPSCWS